MNALVSPDITAADMMRTDLVSLRAEASVTDALTLLVTRGMGVTAVIDDAGHPVGVVSQSDLLIHLHERLAATTESLQPDHTLVHELMTPAVFAVRPEATLDQVAHEMLDHDVHWLFIVDGAGVLVGIVSAVDVLRRLKTS